MEGCASLMLWIMPSTHSNIWQGPSVWHLMITLCIEVDEELLLSERRSQCRHLQFAHFVHRFIKCIHCSKYTYCGCSLHRIPSTSICALRFAYSMFYLIYCNVFSVYGAMYLARMSHTIWSSSWNAFQGTK